MLGPRPSILFDSLFRRDPHSAEDLTTGRAGGFPSLPHLQGYGKTCVHEVTQTSRRIGGKRMSLLGGLLPPIGLEIPCSCYAVNVPLMVNVLGVITLDFKGGIKVRVEANL